MIGNDGRLELRIEVVCDLELFNWSFQFGIPGVLNELKILKVIQHFSKVLAAEFNPENSSYTIR